MPDDTLGAMLDEVKKDMLEMQLSAHAAQVALEARAMTERARPRAARDYAQAASALVRCDAGGVGGVAFLATAEKCRLAVERILAEDNGDEES